MDPEKPSAFARVSAGKVTEIIQATERPAKTLPVYDQRPTINPGQKIGEATYIVKDTEVTRTFEVVDDPDAERALKGKLTDEVLTMGLRKAQVFYPAIVDLDTLKFVSDFIASVKPEALNLAAPLAKAKAVYAASEAAINHIQAAPITDLIYYDVNVDPEWPQ